MEVDIMKRKYEDNNYEQPTLRNGVENGFHNDNCQHCRLRNNMHGTQLYYSDVGPVDNPVSYCEYTINDDSFLVCDTFGCGCSKYGFPQHTVFLIDVLNLSIKLPTHHLYADVGYLQSYLFMKLGFERCEVYDRHWRPCDDFLYVELTNMPFRIRCDRNGVLRVNWNKLMHALNGNIDHIEYAQTLEKGLNIKMLTEDNNIMTWLEFSLSNQNRHPPNKLRSIYHDIKIKFASIINENRENKFKRDEDKFSENVDELYELAIRFGGDLVRVKNKVGNIDAGIMRILKARMEQQGFVKSVWSTYNKSPRQTRDFLDKSEHLLVENKLKQGMHIYDVFKEVCVPDKYQKKYLSEFYFTDPEGVLCPKDSIKVVDDKIKWNEDAPLTLSPKLPVLLNDLEISNSPVLIDIPIVVKDVPKREKKIIEIRKEKKSSRSKVEAIKKKNVVKTTKALEGLNVSEALASLIEKPKTEIKINKVVMEGQETGLNVNDTKPITVGYHAEDDIRNENEDILPKVVVVDDDKDIKEPKSFGRLDILHRIGNTLTYHYRFTNARLIDLFANSVKKIAVWTPALVALVVIMMRIGKSHAQGKTAVDAFKNLSMPTVLIWTAVQWFLTKVSQSVVISSVCDHVVDIENITQEPQRVSDEKREYDTNFQTTKLDTKIYFKETSSIGILLNSPFGAKLINYASDVTNHVASGELVVNMLSSINLNSTISPTSLLERMAKSTNLGSFIDYNRVDSLFEDVTNGSERLAVAVALSFRCYTLNTNVFHQVFRETGDMFLLPVKEVRDNRKLPHSIWMRKGKIDILVSFFMDTVHQMLNLRSIPFRTIPLMLLRNIWRLTIRSLGHLWQLVSWMFIFLLYYLDLTLLILILLSMVFQSGWPTIRQPTISS